MTAEFTGRDPCVVPTIMGRDKQVPPDTERSNAAREIVALVAAATTETNKQVLGTSTSTITQWAFDLISR